MFINISPSAQKESAHIVQTSYGDVSPPGTVAFVTQPQISGRKNDGWN